MFCSLCKAEYRQGFTHCSDCRVPLVATEAAAEAVPVQLFWDGDNGREAERILDALADAGIPYKSQEGLKSQPWPWISLLFFRFAKPKPTSEFKVWIFQADSERAVAATTLPPSVELDADA